MGSLIIRNASYVVTMNDNREILKDCDILIENGFIKEIGKNIEKVSKSESKVIDAKNSIVYPGLVNTHHHFYQVLTRHCSDISGVRSLSHVKSLYRMWRGITGDMVYTSAIIAMGELMKYGCTTIYDHHCIFTNWERGVVDRQIHAAQDLGVRIHSSRGSISIGEADGGFVPDVLVQKKRDILADSERLIEEYHDPSRGSMAQIVLAPSSPYLVSKDILVESAELARNYNVRLHTHLGETMNEEAYSIDRYGMRPLEYMESAGWTGEDVWFAHGTHLSDDELGLLARTRTGVSHCPTSSQKHSTEIAKIGKMIRMGIPVGLGVGGSASNASSNLMSEIKAAFMLQRMDDKSESMTGDDVLAIATRGGATVLGRDDIGSIEVGKAGDCFLVKSNCLEFSGWLDNPANIPAVVGINRHVDKTIVAGKVVYEDGKLTNIDEEKMLRNAELMSGLLKELA